MAKTQKHEGKFSYSTDTDDYEVEFVYSYTPEKRHESNGDPGSQAEKHVMLTKISRFLESGNSVIVPENDIDGHTLFKMYSRADEIGYEFKE